MRAYERLLRYAEIHTTSDEKADGTPSTPGQFELAGYLAEEMIGIGFQNVSVDEHAYVYGTIPATAEMERKRPIALIAHLDTAPDFPGERVMPQVIEHYDGRSIQLGEQRLLDPEQFPDLREVKGQTLITTDGRTLLGADDKAGIAEILTACEEIIRMQLPHGRIAVCFTPDEEIGHGARLLSLEKLGADYAYTVDGGDISEINVETFHAAEAEVLVQGVNVHPGDAKNIMKNASLIAMELNALLPAAERPEYTEGYEGFFHLTEMEGTVERAVLHYILRDHEARLLEEKKTCLKKASSLLNERYGEGTVTVQIREQYRNMKEILDRIPEVTERAQRAIRRAGLEPRCVPVRGGTDGSQLSFRGLPCANLGTGGVAFHGPYEHITAENMNLMTEILRNLLTDPDAD